MRRTVVGDDVDATQRARLMEIADMAHRTLKSEIDIRATAAPSPQATVGAPRPNFLKSLRKRLSIAADSSHPFATKQVEPDAVVSTKASP